MAKVKSIYQCQECGATSSQWAGQCPGCQAWNTLVESVQAPEPIKVRSGGYAGATPERSKLSAIKPERLARLGSGYSEFDRVLGGGFVSGSVILLGGAPGAGAESFDPCELSEARSRWLSSRFLEPFEEERDRQK